MNQTDYEELVLLMAYDLEALADAARPYRGITRAQRAELVGWFKQEFRRLAKHDGDKHGCCLVDRTRRVVRAVPALPPHLTPMPLPACLRSRHTEAGLVALGLPRTAYVRPQSRFVERDYS